MALINSKIRESRSFLRLNQEEFAEKAGLTQFDVSALENDKKKFLPTPFLKFLVSKGIDLRKLLDDTIPLEEFRKDPTGNTVPSITESCTLCEQKDYVIQALQNTIEAHQSTIKALERELGLPNSNCKKGRAAG